MTDKPKTMHCSLHCCSCDAHFHGLGAFDRHRIGAWDKRECIDPALATKMQSTPGLCDKMPGCWADGKHVHDEPGLIWQEI